VNYGSVSIKHTLFTSNTHNGVHCVTCMGAADCGFLLTDVLYIKYKQIRVSYIVSHIADR